MDPRSGFQLAVAHYRQGQLELAETKCRAALKREPKNIAGLHLLAMIQFRQGRSDDSVATFDRLLKRADVALYKAKMDGRNRVVAHEQSLLSINFQGRSPVRARLR